MRETIYVVYTGGYSGCDESECTCSDEYITAVYATEQTAKQHVDRHPDTRYTSESVLTKLRSY